MLRFNWSRVRVGLVVGALIAAIALPAAVGLAAKPSGTPKAVTSSSVFSLENVGLTAAGAGATTPTLVPMSTKKYVYITDTGSKYHRKGCRYLRYSRYKVTLKYAKSHGYGACKICKPPKK